MREKISIIIPCYNVESVLSRCLDSIFCQDIDVADYEVICVDDNSTDGTLNLLCEYEKSYPESMIVIALEENGKQGKARNIALGYASGNYVMYVDADDVLAPNILKRLYKTLIEYNCDVAECNYKSFSVGNSFIVESIGKAEIYDMTDAKWRKACILRRFPKTAPWGRLYKRELLTEQDIFFPEGITMEDTYFSELCMAHMKKYVWLPETLYFYYINPNGTYYGKKAINYYMDTLIVQNMATDRIRMNGLLPDCEKELEYLYFLKAFCDPIARMIKNKDYFSYKNYEWAYRELLERYPLIGENPYVWQSKAELLMFSRELSKRLFFEDELAMALYGDDYKNELDCIKVHNNTKVSVLVVTSNQKTALCETLESLLQQSYKNLEIVIVDDASSDGTLETIQELFGDKENIYYLRNEMMQGIGASYNAGAACASGFWLAFAECGTIWQPDRLEIQITSLTKNKKWNYCDVVVGEQTFPRTDWEEYKRVGMLMPTLFMENQINLMGVLLKKECFEELEGFDEDLPEQQEYDFLLRLSEKYYGEELQCTLVYTVPKSVQTENYVAADVYLLMKYSKQLSRLELKKEKLVQVMDNAGYLGAIDILWKYVDLLLEDADYAEALNDYVEKRNLVRFLEQSIEDTILGVQHCTGCAVCQEICPTKAIYMKYDEGGFLVPEIDDEKCVHCGKCVRQCPTQVDLQGNFRKQICYAVQAGYQYQDRGSSGGVFPALAEYALENGWYVAGAVFDEDFSVRHIVSNSKEDIIRMYGSKYVQSNMQELYPQIANLLKKGEIVLFSGVACQVAGLKAYLQCDYCNLYTVDVVCHGVPSPKAWQNYLGRLSEDGKEIIAISFRDKHHLGWKTGLYVKYSDGSEVSDEDDAYVNAFLNNWILRESCYQCNFKGESYSDITLGDFWGIETLDEEFGNRGTSFVTVNSFKGEQLYHSIDDIIIQKRMFPVSAAIIQNHCIETPVLNNAMHDMLQNIWEEGKWEKALEEVYGKLHFDVALVCLWSNNYGNAITNYALYHTLDKLCNVIAIDTGITYLKDRFLEFSQKYFRRSSEFYPRGEWEALQNNCDTFLVGSDQVWNSKYAKGSNWGTFFQLGFISSDKRKVSYASSFGQEGLQPTSEGMKKLYQEFSKLSVREEFGVNVCREQYHMDAKQVLDPVFLLEAEEYDDLLEEIDIDIREPFIAAYLLNPTGEKRDFCEKVKSMFDEMKIIYLIDNAPETKDLYRHILRFENVKVGLRVEEWLYYLRNAQYIITDSFHGTCFSIIFQKPFLSFVNRQTDRFKFFEKLPGISEHILSMVDAEFCDKILEQIDYDAVDKELSKERQCSLKWLKDALFA